MKNRIDWKKFAQFAIGLLLFFLLFDVVSDSLKGKIVWEEIWAMKNLFFKVAASLVGAYFASTFNDDDKE